jgi:gliding motility-associated-like protein
MTSTQKNNIVVFFLMLLSYTTHAQKDTLFWFAAPEISSGAGDNPIFLRFLSYDNPASVTVDLPANGAFIPITLNLPANSLDSINLTPFLAQIESPAANVVSNTGIRVVSTSLISAFYEMRAPNNRASFSLKGNKGMGTNFYTPFQRNYANAVTTPASFSSFEIVATENATTVLITPRTAITGHTANSTFSITLNQGQTYSGRDMNVSAVTSLAGSIISANKPISVTVFEGSLVNSTCSDAIGDQITTTAYIGNKHIVRKGTTASERIYILATENSTAITITGSGTTTTLINWSETYTVNLTDEINFIETSKPVYIYHVGGYGCELSSAQVPALLCSGTYSTAFTRTSSDSLGIILYTRSGFEDDFTLNGVAGLIQASDFQNVPGTAGEFRVASIYFDLATIPLHSHNVIANTGDIFGLGVRQGTDGSASNYAYMSEFSSYPFVNAGTDQTTCANVALPINGVVGGGSVTGTWSTSGFGTFQNGNTALNNVYVPSPLDTLITPIQIILTSTGPCPLRRDTISVSITPSPLVNASADQTVCENNSLVQLDGAIGGGSSLGEWTTLGTGSFAPNPNTLDAVYTPSAADFTAGFVSLVLSASDLGACNMVRDTMIVTFTTAAIVDAGADTITVCSNNPSVSLSGSVSGSTTTGKWVTSGNGLFLPNNLSLSCTYQPGSQDIANGGVWLYLESTNNGNCSIEMDSAFVEFTESPVVDAGVNQIICSNATEVNLNGLVSGPTISGQWTGGNGTFVNGATALSGIYIPSTTEVSGGNLVLTLTSTNNGTCNAVSDVFQIQFVAPPFANFNNNNVCLGESTQLTDFSLAGFGSIQTWNWSLGDGTNSLTQNTTHTYSAPGTYNVQLIVTSSVGCVDTLVRNVDVYAIPTAAFTTNVVCLTDIVQVSFTDQSTPTGGIASWQYDFGGQGSASVQNPVQIFNSGFNYSITQIVTSTNGCKDTIVQALTIPSLPEAGFFYNSSNGLNVGAIFNFIDTSFNAINWSWNFGDGNNSGIQNPSNTYFSNGIYPVTLYAYNSLGCVDSATTFITINTVTTEISTLIPNVITPNNDGKNDTWKLEFIDLLFPNAVVEVYNQWGQQLYYSEGYAYPWDGTYQGELVPDGNYFYIITLNAGLEKDQFKGALLVLKSRN